MHINDFATAKLDDLVQLTGIHRSTWSRYFNRRQGISEQTLTKIANKFGVEPEIMLSAIQDRRENPPIRTSGGKVRGQAA